MKSPCALVFASLAFLSATSARAQPSQTAPEVRYRSERVEGPATLQALRKTHGAAGFDAILRMNRLDLPHVRQGTTLIVPENPATVDALAPFPVSLQGDSVASRLIVVSRRIQAFAAYEAGALARWGPVSSGRKETPTPEGLFATNWKSKLRRSTDNREWLLPWYVNFINETGVSFHQFALPGYPASHACVRLLEVDAKWIYDWAETWVLDDQRRRVVVHGTPVLVYGEYDYQKPGPWTQLTHDPRATTISAEEIDMALAPHRARLAEWARQR